MVNIIKWSKYFLHELLCPYKPNPGWDLASMLFLGGFLVLTVSLLLQQLGYGRADPVILEIGKAAFYTGIGSAGTKATIRTGDDETDKESEQLD